MYRSRRSDLGCREFAELRSCETRKLNRYTRKSALQGAKDAKWRVGVESMGVGRTM